MCVCVASIFCTCVCVYESRQHTWPIFFLSFSKAKKCRKKWSVGSVRLFLFFPARRECRMLNLSRAIKIPYVHNALSVIIRRKLRWCVRVMHMCMLFFSPVAHILQNLFTRRAISNDCPIFLTTYVIKINRTRVCVYIIIFFNL